MELVEIKSSKNIGIMYRASDYLEKKHKEDYRIQKICLERTYR